MSLHKTFLKTKPVCKVRFSLTPDEVGGASGVCLSGDFNEWSTEALPMKRQKNGGFSIELALPLGQDYQFRYVLDDGRWINDSQADAYVLCRFTGVDNSLVKV